MDSLVGRVLDDLERRKLLESTVVLVTSDHGMEFDENGQGFTGHGTSYSRYQMHIPLVLGWPGRPPGRVARRTSHNDVAPTLVAGLFGCANPASDYASGRDLFSEGEWDWLIAARPDGDGLDVLRAAKAQAPETEVILLTAYAEWKSAKEAIRLGALDYFEKGQEPDELYHRIDKALGARALRRENENLRAQLRERYGLPGLIAQSPAMHAVLDLVERVAPTDATLLIQGESGTGKEVIAKAVHHASTRASRPFVAVNCGAVPETLLESELFGYMRGAFTGAAASKHGLFEEADGGTLFLDEIAEMPAALQVKLLRALQSGEVRRLGATQATTIDVRVIAATHGDLAALISQGTFREDLFYRLNVIQVVLPPLRDRREDIPALAEHFLARAAGKLGRQLRLAPPTLPSWPGWREARVRASWTAAVVLA